MSSSGLVGAPTTKLWIIWQAFFYLLLGTLRLPIVPNTLLSRHLASLLTFPTVPQLILSSVIIYQLRALERLMGAGKYASFLFVSAVISQTLLVVSNSRPVVGPYSLVFACMVQFARTVPARVRMPVFGGWLAAGDKWGLYGQTLVVLALSPSSRLPYSAMSCGAGVLAGIAYGFDVAGLTQWRFPAWMNSLFSRWFVKGSQQTAPPAPAVPQQQIDTLKDMFPNISDARIGHVLRTTGGDRNRAINILLES